MDLEQVLLSLAGGAIIGLAVTAMLLFNGRVVGISGILSGALKMSDPDRYWRFAFLGGLLLGGLVLFLMAPEMFANTTQRSWVALAFAGFLVGFGTVMGSGCTSGHGVCGVSRLSPRSLVATGTFMFFGFLTVALFRIFSRGAL